MAGNPIRNEQIVNLQPLIEDGKTLVKVIDELTKSAQEFSIEAKKAIEAFDLSKSKDVQNLNKLLQVLKTSSKQVSDAQKERAKVERELIKNQAEQEKLSQQRLRTEAQAVKSERERIRNSQLLQREKERQLKQQEREEKRQKQLNSAYSQASRRLNDLRNRYKDLAVQNKENTAEGQKLLRNIIALDTRLKRIDKTVGQSQRFVGEYERALGGLGRGVTALAGGIGLAVGGVEALTQSLRFSFGLFSDFELQLSKIRAVTGANEEEFGQLKQTAIDLGSSTAFTATNVAELQLNLSKLGFTTTQIQDSTRAILDFAIATDSDLGQAATVGASTLNAYNLEASEAARISDVAAESFNSTALDIEKFSTAIAIVGPAAQASGVSIEQTTAILGKIVDAGIDASSAGTALRNVFIDIAAQGISLDDALSQIVNSQNKLTAANDLFGKRGAIVAKVVADNVEEINTLEEAFINAEGAAGRASEIIGDNLAGDVNRFRSALEGLFLQRGRLNTFFRGIVQSVTEVLNIFSKAREETEQTIDSNIELARSTSISIEANTKLVDSYEELASKTELTTEEKEELDAITNDLILTFGESVVSIDEETGALIVNIEAVKAKIQADAALNSEAARNLLAERQRITAQIALAEGAEQRISDIGDRINGVFGELNFFSVEIDRLISAAAEGGIFFSREFSKIRQEAARSGRDISELEKVFGTFDDALISAGNSIGFLAKNQEDLAKIDQAIKDLGIDLNAIAEEELELLNKRINLNNSRTEREEKQLLTVAEIQQRILKLQKELNGELEVPILERVPEKINKISSEIDSLNKLLNSLRDNLEDIDQIGLLDDVIEDSDQLKSEIDEINSQFLAGLRFRQQKEDEAAAERERKRQEELEQIQQGFQSAQNFISELNQRRLNALDEQLQKVEDRETQIREAINSGNQQAIGSLSELDRERSRIQQQRRRESEQQARRELAIASFQAFAENIGDGEGNALGRTFVQILALNEFWKNIPLNFSGIDSNFHGTDDTGTVANPLDAQGGRFSILHDNEQVWSKRDREQVGFRTRDEVIDIVNAHDNFVQTIDTSDVPVINVREKESKKLSELVDTVKDLSSRIKDREFNYDAVNKMAVEVIESKGRRERKHKKIGGMYG